MTPKNPSTSTTVSVSNPSAFVPPSDLSEDIIVSILKRLPVKSILRFKCVSKDWLSLLCSPSFISIHLQETLKTPLNYSIIIDTLNEYGKHVMYLLNVSSAERETISFVNPLPVMFREMEFVGSVNGLLCLACYPYEKMVILWNPAMNLYKAIRLRIPDKDTLEVSLGFAYDSVNDDYFIIRIDCLKPSPEALLRSRAEVYSASLDSWKGVQIDFAFVKLECKNYVTVNGIPYWSGVIYEANSQCRVLVYYDMRNGSFKRVPLPDNDLHYYRPYVEWKGNLGRIVYKRDFVDIWVYDEIGECWNKISSHGPIELDKWRPLQWSRDGMILAVTEKRKLMLYDPLTNGIKEFCTPRVERFLCETFTYTESLVIIKGMEKVKERGN